MIDEWLTDYLRWIGGRPTLRIRGKVRCERAWRIIDVYASARRNRDSCWPLLRASCVTFTSEIIGVEERRVLFQVVARTEDEVIGEGTHERGIINIAKFATRLAEKMRRK